MKWLVDNFLSYLENDAIVYNNKQYTYQNLYDQVLDFSQGFLKDVERGEVVAIVGDYSFNSIALMLALYENNNIVVPIAATVELEINDRAREAYCDKSINVETLKIERIKNSLNKHNMIDILQKKSESGLILFSSGSTGKPKAMVHSLDNLINSYQDKRVKKVNMLIFLMFDHIGGLNTMFNALSMGNNLVLPKDKSAEGVCSLIEEYKIKVLPSSPTFLNLIFPSIIVRFLSSLFSVIWFWWSIIGRILLAAANPWFMAIFKVAKDLTGWYANIIAARNEKKLLILISSLIINLPE